MTLKYDFDIHWLASQDADTLCSGDEAEDTPPVFVALFRDPATVAALSGADARVRQTFEASGFGFSVGQSELPDGVFPAFDGAARRNAIGRLSRNIPKYRLKGARFNGFNLAEFLDYVVAARGVDEDELEELLFALDETDCAIESDADEVLEPHADVEALPEAMDPPVAQKIAEEPDAKDDISLRVKLGLEPQEPVRAIRPPRIPLGVDVPGGTAERRMVVPPRPEPERVAATGRFDAAPRAMAKAGLAAGVSLMIGSVMFAGLGSTSHPATAAMAVMIVPEPAQSPEGVAVDAEAGAQN